MIRRMWQRWVRWTGRARLEILASDEILDSVPPEDVDPLARYLWAMCWDRPGLEYADFALAAVMWLVYGTVDPAAFPVGADPLSEEARAGLPLPYRDRTDTTV